MPYRSRLVQLSLSLPAEDYSAYVTAVRLLARKMGDHAPDVAALLVHTLCRRDAAGLVEDFLEAVDWPLRMRRRKRGQHDLPVTRAHSRRTRLPRWMVSTKVDPSRN